MLVGFIYLLPLCAEHRGWSSRGAVTPLRLAYMTVSDTLCSRLRRLLDRDPLAERCEVPRWLAPRADIPLREASPPHPLLVRLSSGAPASPQGALTGTDPRS